MIWESGSYPKQRETKMPYPDEILTKWKLGEIFELALYFNDTDECKGTFFRWIDLGIGYEYPSFFYGNEAVYEKYQIQLVEHAQCDRVISV